MLERIPLVWRAILGVAAIFGTGITVGAAASHARDLPGRVVRLEQEQKALREALAYLTCRALEEDAGRDPRSCRARMRSLEDYVGGVARGGGARSGGA